MTCDEPNVRALSRYDINQTCALLSISRKTLLKYTVRGAMYWVTPCIVLLAGIVILVKPIWIASAPLVIIAIFLIIYGIAEFINSIKIYSIRRKVEKQAALVVDPLKEEGCARLKQSCG